MTMSARKAKRRVVDMMASTVRIELRWMASDAEGRRVAAWLRRNEGRWASMLRQYMRDATRIDRGAIAAQTAARLTRAERRPCIEDVDAETRSAIEAGLDRKAP